MNTVKYLIMDPAARMGFSPPTIRPLYCTTGGRPAVGRRAVGAEVAQGFIGGLYSISIYSYLIKIFERRIPELSSAAIRT